MRIIDRLEPGPRGVYCGAIGLLAPPEQGPRATFSVAIRTAVIDRRDDRLTYGAGGGITWGSDPAAEDAEAEAKARVLREPRPSFALLETLRVADGAILRLDAHLSRLARAAAWFGFDLDESMLHARLAALDVDSATGAAAQRLRILLRRDGAASCELVPLPAAPELVRLTTAAGRLRTDDPFTRCKTTHRVAYELARAEAPLFDDVVLINEVDEVVETTVANLLYRWNGRWYTPPSDSGGLDGIGRQALIDDGQIRERRLFVSELSGCEALAVVSSLRGVRPAQWTAGVDDRQCVTDLADGVDAHEVGAAQRGEAAGTDGRRIPFLDLGCTAEHPEESLA